MPTKFEELTVAQLKNRLVEADKQSRETMAPLLFFLRQKLRARGARNDLHRKREGFGEWVDKNLSISRRTADLWANQWAIVQGLKKPPSTCGSTSKSSAGKKEKLVAGPGLVLCNLSLLVTQAKEDELLKAWAILGDDEATVVICNALTEAAKQKSPPLKDTFEVENLGELNTIDTTQGKPAQTTPTSRLTFLEGEAS